MAVNLSHRLGAPLRQEIFGLITPETTSRIRSIILITIYSVKGLEKTNWYAYQRLRYLGHHDQMSIVVCATYDCGN